MAVQPDLGIITARSERQAMDWSLVLMSQGIESTIEHSPETHQWQLSVPRLEYQRAIQAIKQYHVENKRGVWVRELPWPGLLLDWRAFGWAAVVVTVFILNEAADARWQAAGLMNNQLVARGEWWRLFTATALHADVAHLAVNVTTGFLLVGLAMGSYGAGLGLLISYLAGIGGNLAGFFLYGSTHQSLGASGIVMGALGLVTIQSLGPWGIAARELFVRAICGGFLLLVLLGLSPDPQTDIIAHLGGFATGLALGAPLALWRGRVNRAVDAIALCLFGLLVIVPWALALRQLG
jgi:rhomboid protease GluP